MQMNSSINKNKGTNSKGIIKPKIMMITGAIAISGTERSSIATGMSACSAPLLNWKS